MDDEKNDSRGEMWGKRKENAITEGRRTRKKDRAKKKQRNFMHLQRKILHKQWAKIIIIIMQTD